MTDALDVEPPRPFEGKLPHNHWTTGQIESLRSFVRVRLSWQSIAASYHPQFSKDDVLNKVGRGIEEGWLTRDAFVRIGYGPTPTT